ncbi:hypothetical protein [Nocardioides luteus]|uniref:hypothetical protein n=1 Tax=Nocardioides luteus TaxID=1844 RepID=UPI0018CB1A51|nr:hypothetical protein [Nocardioides luteus]MBG6096983.1 TPP-dependent pyruvate/acetoin dehydrogenase alpha subunit [Nocardioides luteus]
MRADGQLTDEALTAMEAEISAEIDLAVAAAEEGPLEPVEELTRFVRSDEEAS